MNSSQARFLASLIALLLAAAAWLYSFHAFPGKGLLRTAILFALSWLLMRPYDEAFLSTSHPLPMTRNAFGAIVACWLFFIFAAILTAQHFGFSLPTGYGIHRPLGLIILGLPLFGPLAWRLWRTYVSLGVHGA